MTDFHYSIKHTSFYQKLLPYYTCLDKEDLALFDVYIHVLTYRSYICFDLMQVEIILKIFSCDTVDSYDTDNALAQQTGLITNWR